MTKLSCPCAFKSAVLNDKTVAEIQPIFDETLLRTVDWVRGIFGQETDLQAAPSAWLPKKNALATTFTMTSDSEHLIRFCVAKFQKDFCQAIEAGVTAMPASALKDSSSEPTSIADMILLRRIRTGSVDGASPSAA